MNNTPDPKQDQANAGGGAQSSAHPLDNYTVSPKGGDSDEKSPYYKSAAPVISMPKGGGALKGIDEKFTVNAVNGSASLDVPFPFTPGRGGFTPALSVSYNSGAGNGPFGLGFSLGLAEIRRRTDKKLPQYNDANESDVFILAGAEDMVPLLVEDGGNWVPDVFTDGNYTVKRYRPRIEGLWARIEHIFKEGTAGSSWKVTTKDNKVTFYGLTAEARIADPSDASRIYSWLPQISYDNIGNVMLYGYVPEDLVNVALSPHEYNRLNGNAPITNTYLKRVHYCNRTPWLADETHIYNVSDILPDTEDFLMEGVLDYGDHDTDEPTPATSTSWPARTDAFSDFHSGFEIRTYRRCRRVLMFHYFDELAEGDAVLVRSLNFTYRQDSELAPLAEADLITEIGQTGYMINPGGGYYSKSLPSITMRYQPLAWDNTIHNVHPDDFQNAPQGLTGPYEWIDLWGEGLPGILTEQGHGWFYKRNLGEGHFSPALEIAPKPSLQGLGAGLQWQDLDADGRRQLVSMDTSLPGYFELTDDQEWQPFRSFVNKINVDWSSPFTHMLDLDGDGRPDMLITEDRVWKWYENEGKQGFTEGGYFSPGYDEETAPRLLHNDMVQTIFLADMNGDGLTDIVRIKNGEVCYWSNMGFGRFGAKVTMSNAPVFDTPELFNPIYITLADISGTGAPDLFYLGHNKCTAWINMAGNGFGDAVDIFLLPDINAQSKIMVTDFLGNGTASIVWSSPLPQHGYAPMRYVDLMGGRKPYLMTSYSNGMGKTIAVRYKQSTKYYLEDMRAGTPWATMLPFPVHCIERITTSDAVSETQYTQTFRYHHGYYDHEEREFRGFGRVDTVDIDTAVGFDEDGITENDLDQYPVLTKTWYHTGAWMREGTLLEAFAAEYYPTTWAELPTAPFIHDTLSSQEQREAYRALKGQTLRQEVYGIDASPVQDVPYSVATNAFAIRRVQPVAGNRYASFFSYQRESLAWSAERNVADPRVTHNLTLEIDELGNTLRAATVAYPRIASEIPIDTPTVVADVQQRMLITTTVSEYTNDVLSGGYHLRLPYDARTYEVTGTPLPPARPLWTPDLLLPEIIGAAEIDFTATPTGTDPEIRLISHGRTIFQTDDCTTPLTLGTIESLAIPYNQYTLAFTDDVLSHANYYDGRVTGTMLAEGGYLCEDTIIPFASADDTRWWLPGGTSDIDTAHFYTPTVFYDPWGNTTTITYWDDAGTGYYLLPQSTTDAVGNVTTVNEYNWYNLQPTRITDINENQGHIVYDALGMAVAAAMMEKDGSVTGDTITGIDPNDTADITAQAAFFTDPEAEAHTLLQGASWRCVYDLSTTPTAVGMIARELHNSEDPDSPVLIRLTYTDGLGRIAMDKVQAAPMEGETDIRWLGNGKTIYNNKGKEVMRYEPYFTDNPLFDDAEYAATHGVTPRIHYDAVGRACRIDMPDGTFTKTEWDAWLQKNYDANDTVDDSAWYAAAIIGTPEQQDAAAKAHQHYNTPLTVYLDTLGRTFYTIQHNRIPDPSDPPNWLDLHYESHTDLDIAGNNLAIHNARGLTPLTYTYNILAVPVQKSSIDSGQSMALSNVAGLPLYAWDADEREVHSTYDALLRPLTNEVTPSGGSTIVMQKIEYGEGVTDDALHNLRGMPYELYEGTGKKTITDYDFKGAAHTTEEQFLQDYTIIDVDWDAVPTLNAEIFTTAVTYDALGRVITATDPGNNITRNEYDLNGALFAVYLTPNGGSEDDYVTAIYYDEKGRRQKIYYGNGTNTTYTYNPLNYRLTRLLTRKAVDIFQDLNYWYDPVGNITIVKDDAQRTLFFNNAITLPQMSYTYDAGYQLIQANGREQIGIANFGSNDNYNDSPWMGITHKGDDNNTQNYIQKYTYDEVGNILSLQHIADTASYTRNYTYDTDSNRLLSTTVGANTYTYDYDNRGNIIAMPHLVDMAYNHQNQLSVLDLGGGGDAYYQYSSGQRTRKVVVNGAIHEERMYMGAYELYRKYISGVLSIERTTAHVGDNTGRVAMLEVRTTGSDPAPASLVRYIYTNHLGTASLELDDTAAIISYEEYHPYGTTSYQAMNATINAVAKRYRYTGKERDEESGLYYHGARYYMPWLMKWNGVDPLEEKSTPFTPYNYCDNNPIMLHDPTGAEGEPGGGGADGGGAGTTPTPGSTGGDAKVGGEDPSPNVEPQETPKEEPPGNPQDDRKGGVKEVDKDGNVITRDRRADEEWDNKDGSRTKVVMYIKTGSKGSDAKGGNTSSSGKNNSTTSSSQNSYNDGYQYTGPQSSDDDKIPGIYASGVTATYSPNAKYYLTKPKPIKWQPFWQDIATIQSVADATAKSAEENGAFNIYERKGISRAGKTKIASVNIIKQAKSVGKVSTGVGWVLFANDLKNAVLEDNEILIQKVKEEKNLTLSKLLDLITNNFQYKKTIKVIAQFLAGMAGAIAGYWLGSLLGGILLVALLGHVIVGAAAIGALLGGIVLGVILGYKFAEWTGGLFE